MGDWNKCPGGHNIPSAGPNGDCTPLRCGFTAAQRAKTKYAEKKKAEMKAPKEPPPEEKLAKLESEEDIKLQIAAKRYRKWSEFVGAPGDLDGDAAEKWTDNKLVNLLPVAVGVLELNLKYGTPEQQERAANKVLDANGRGKRETVAASTPPIVINMVNGGDLPWRQTAKVEVVDGSVKAALPSKLNTDNT